MRIGIFADIHFQPKGLNRIISTGQWIIEEYRRIGVTRVFCLGDSLNTREEVSVESQSACIEFFKALAEEWPVDVLLGNHDMNLKHDRRVSSLDCLGLHPNITLHREPGLVQLDHSNALMLPYYEDQSKIVRIVQALREQHADKVSNYVVMGHLSLNGAVQISRYNTTFRGAMGPDIFEPFKRTFSGHFHVHNEMSNRVTYVGSPLQFNFGDAGDSRGIMVYETESDEAQFIRNPFCDAFMYLDANELQSVGPDHDALIDCLKDRFVTLVYTDQVSEEQYREDMAILEGWGAIQVRKESIIEKNIIEEAEEKTVQAVNIQTAADLVPYFVDKVVPENSSLDKDRAIDFGQNLMRRVNETFQDVSDTGTVFDGTIAWVHMQGFMGIQEPILFRFDDMKDGIWYLEGENGAGKSTILEAIFWCLFGERIRSDCKVDDVINDVLGKNCKVIVGYENGWAIERFRKAGKDCQGYDGESLSGSGVRCYLNRQYQPQMERGEPKATQRSINDLLGINADMFLKTQIMGQNLASNFITADEKKRRAMIEEMLGMERFDSYLEAVREQKKTLAAEREQQQSIQRIRAEELQRTTDNISNMESKIIQAKDNWQANIDKESQSLQDRQKELKTRAEEWGKEQERLSNDIQHALEKKVASEKSLEDFQDALDAESKARAMAEEIKRLNGAASHIRNYEHQVAKTQEDGERDLERLQQFIDQTMRDMPPLPDDYDDAVQAHRIQERDRCQQIMQELQAEHSKHVAKAQSEQGIIERIKAGMDQGSCSQCGQSLMTDESRAKINADIAEHQAIKDDAEHQAVVICERITSSSRDLATINGQIVDPAVLEKRRELSIKISEAEANRKNIQQMVSTAVEANTAAAMRQYELVTAQSGSGMSLDQMALSVEEIRTQKSQQAKDLIDGSQDALMAYHEAKRNHEAVVCEHSDAATKYSVAKSSHEQAVNAVEQWITHHQKQLEDLKNDKHVISLQEEIQRYRDDHRRVMNELEESKRRSADIQDQQAYVLFWDKAFAVKGGMRSFMMRDSVQTLNELIAGFVSYLFDNGMTLTFTEELTVVESYGKRSGGQRKRTDLASLFATFTMSRQRLRYRSSMLAVDEAFDALDKTGIRQVQEIINLLANQLRKVMVITHADITGATMAGGIYASMSDHGTIYEKREI